MSSAAKPVAPTVIESMGNAYGAGQRLILDRIELLVLQATETSARFARTGALAASGVALVGLGWMCLVGAALAWLAPSWSWPVALGFAGMMHVAAGGAFLASSSTRTNHAEPGV